MTSMTDKRRKEMEEEMSRFELEISGPSDSDIPSRTMPAHTKALEPPPKPPVVGSFIPTEMLIKAPPPPPPPSLSPPLRTPLRPPPPPPRAPQFVPSQVQRHPPPRHMMRHPMGMRGHLPPPPPPPNHFGHADPFGQPMAGPMMPPMGPMFPGPPMMGGPMFPGPMPHGNHPMPPGFCPPGTRMLPPDPQMFPPSDIDDMGLQENPAMMESAPTVYAAPFVKSQSETIENSSMTRVLEDGGSVFSSPVAQKPEKMPTSKALEDSTMSVNTPVPSQPVEEVVVSKKKEKKKKIVRMAGGQAWEDNSLLDWETDDFRIFCGDLGNDVTDEVLIRAFSKYSSFVKAKVVRDKRTNKTKGFGFISFKDPQDFIKAMREMNGRYVGSRPIKLRKSTWRDRNIDLVKKKHREKERLGLL